MEFEYPFFSLNNRAINWLRDSSDGLTGPLACFVATCCRGTILQKVYLDVRAREGGVSKWPEPRSKKESAATIPQVHGISRCEGP